MVDRYKSLVGQEEISSNQHNNSINPPTNKDPILNLIAQTQNSSKQLKQCIKNYRNATTSKQQLQLVQQFKTKCTKLQKTRTILSTQYKNLPTPEDNPQKLLLKQHLLKTVQLQLKLDVEMNQMIENKKNKLQLETKTMTSGTIRLKNAENDLLQKRQQIIYLQEQVKQCVQLLQLIGVLVLENTNKINQVLSYVQQANTEIDKSLKVINKAKINQSKCRRKMCCIIVLGLIAIVVILFVVLKVDNIF